MSRVRSSSARWSVSPRSPASCSRSGSPFSHATSPRSRSALSRRRRRVPDRAREDGSLASASTLVPFDLAVDAPRHRGRRRVPPGRSLGAARAARRPDRFGLRPADRAAAQRRPGASRRDRRGREGSGAALPRRRPARRRRPRAARLGDAGPRGAAVGDGGEAPARVALDPANDEAKYNLELALQRARGSSSPRARAARTRPRAVAARPARAPAIPEAATRPGGDVADDPHAARSAPRPRRRRPARRASGGFVGGRGVRATTLGLPSRGGAALAAPARARSSSGGMLLAPRRDAAGLRVDTTTGPCARTPRRSSSSTSRARCSRSDDLDSPQRIERAKAAAIELRRRLSGRARRHRVAHRSRAAASVPERGRGGVPGDARPLDRRSSGRRRARRFLTGATSLNALASIRGLRYFTPTSKTRVVDRAHGRRERSRRERPARAASSGATRRSSSSSSSSGARTRRCSHAARPSRSTIRPVAHVRFSIGSRRRRAGAVYSENEIGAAERKAREFLGTARRSSQGRAGGQARARAVPRACRPLPVRAPPVAPRPLSLRPLVAEPRLDGLGEAALVHVRDRAAREPERARRGLAVAEHGPHRLVAGLGPALLAGTRAAEPAERQARRVDVGSVLSVPLDADRPLEQRGRPCRRVVPASSAATKLLLSRPFSPAPGICIPPPNRIGTASSQKYDPALDHGDGGIWIDVRPACRPPRRSRVEPTPRLGEVR